MLLFVHCCIVSATLQHEKLLSQNVLHTSPRNTQTALLDTHGVPCAADIPTVTTTAIFLLAFHVTQESSTGDLLSRSCLCSGQDQSLSGLMLDTCWCLLQGIALSADPNYKVLGAAYPWIARRLLTEQSPELRDTLRSLLYKKGRFQVQPSNSSPYSVLCVRCSCALISAFYPLLSSCLFFCLL